jgi:hypothetical protein
VRPVSHRNPVPPDAVVVVVLDVEAAFTGAFADGLADEAGRSEKIKDDTSIFMNIKL